MARKLGVEYSGAIYHPPSLGASELRSYGGTGVMNRGDRREEIFKDDQDRERFLETLGEACVKTG